MAIYLIGILLARCRTYSPQGLKKRKYLADSDREQDRQAYAIDEIASLNEILNLKLLPPELISAYQRKL
jgi:hypothetical protein